MRARLLCTAAQFADQLRTKLTIGWQRSCRGDELAFDLFRLLASGRKGAGEGTPISPVEMPGPTHLEENILTGGTGDHRAIAGPLDLMSQPRKKPASCRRRFLASLPRSIPEFVPCLPAWRWGACLALRLDYDPGMGFNRRKMEAERKARADAEAAARRAANPQVLADAERLETSSRLERAPSPANAPAIRADDRRRARGPAPFPLGLLPSLPHHSGQPLNQWPSRHSVPPSGTTSVQGDALGVPLREDAEAVLLDFVNSALNQLVS